MPCIIDDMNQDDNSTAAVEYKLRLAAREKSFQLLDKRHKILGNIKIVLLVTAAVVSWLALSKAMLSPYWIALPSCGFIIMIVIHERLIVKRRGALRAVKLYTEGIDRLAGRWAGRGSSGSRFRSSEHPYAEDLDLYGPGSLFELICAARTQAGEAALAHWLGSVGSVAEIRERQRAATELKQMLDLREDIALLGDEAAESANLDRLAGWAAEELPESTQRVRIAAVVLTAITVAAGICAAFGKSPVPLEVSILFGQVFALNRRKSDKAIARNIDTSVRDLEILSSFLRRLEQETFQSTALAELVNSLGSDGEPASKQIAGLLRIVAWKDAMYNNLFVLVGIVLLWNTHIALALERWRRNSGRHVPAWIELVANFEAFSSLSRFAYEQEGVVLPELIDTYGVFEAVGLKHPLLPRADAVANAISVNQSARLYIVSGSNMSGKSTLLRTVGINTVLALAGAPVCAEKLRIGPLHIGASLRAGDSLHAGVSRFYAEIKRLRQIVDIARETPPALFLLDEILHGTNSHDRTVGAEAVIRALLAAGAVGLVTTHDLALARIADDAELNAVNVHFQDEMLDGRMVFDYRLRPGVVTKSNAIPLMRAVGLDV